MGTARRPGRARGVGLHRAMVVALDTQTLLRVETALGGLGCTLVTADNATLALKDLCLHEHSLVVCNYPLPHLLLRHFLQRLRHATCASRHCSMVVLAIPELLSGASRFVGHGANAVLPRWVPQTQLEEALRRLLDVPERCPPSSGLEVRVRNPDGSLIPAEGVVNISASGLLLRSPVRPMLGATVKTVISHPDLEEPLNLPARVVRHTRPGREEMAGFAVTFSGPSLKASLELLSRRVN
ncbi:MAG: hypothetical protein GXP47_12490 [Acidobacteria bacterium]|nr:hypothetical protein [Acidobacteriota bacterium]